ncbi:unnamed protein product [Phyllotreta striolata]|uniref:Leucine-rich melanocyte differentiation-associated protein-like n=1 Tax=Phyllotreta striolata TaxID=444603 RepID=A0A9N9XPA1_PHYSR|nr:unnamed protein product [Phyllotreta striolata]
MNNCGSKIDDPNDEELFRVFDLSQWKGLQFDNEIAFPSDEDMVSLGTLILIEKAISQLSICNNSEEDNDVKLQRLSLAHERLHNMPKVLLEQLAPTVRILDISYNEFESLDFLEYFPELTTLICDHNSITSDDFLPHLPKLELLWMNHCKILDLFKWIYQLSLSCPNLKYLSLMSNPGTPFRPGGRNTKEQIQYRLFVISMFPKLVHLDDRSVSNDELKKSRKLYHKHIINILAEKVQQNLPDCVKGFKRKPLEHAAKPQQKNFIV